MLRDTVRDQNMDDISMSVTESICVNFFAVLQTIGAIALYTYANV